MLGNDDLKSQDEKGSNGDHWDSSNGGGEEVDERVPSAVQSFVSEVKSLEEVAGDVKSELVLGGNEDSVVITERDLKSEESYQRKDVETAKKEHTSGNEGGTSNGESLTEKNSKDMNVNSFGDAIASHKLIKPVDSSPSEINLTTKNVLVQSEETSGNSAAENSKSEVVVPSLQVTNHALKINGDNLYPLNDENATTLNFEEPKPKEHDSKVLNSSSACPITKLTNGAEHIKNTESSECSKNQPRVTSAPIIVRKTAWWNCCGLIEVLSSSDR